MNNEKMQFNLPANCGEIIIREGQAPKLLEPKAPIIIQIHGTIGAPAEYLTHRHMEADQFNVKRAHILVDRENMNISLFFNENDAYTHGFVVGKLRIHPRFLEFGINTDKAWQPNKLGEFFKRNRSFFPDRDTNMKLVSSLKNFQAKVEQSIQQEKQQNGSFTDSFSGVVTSTLPEPFKLRLPIFNGTAPIEFEVEIYADIDGRDVRLSLVSPSANEVIEQMRDTTIDEQIAGIRKLCPDIVIIEQ